jgi:transposase
MPAPVSAELRSAIVRAFHDRHLSYDEVAELLGVGRATVSRVLRRERETGSITPAAPAGGNFSPIAGAVAKKLEALLAATVDATVQELTGALNDATRVGTTRSSVQRALKRLGYTRKKSRSSQRSATRRNTANDGNFSAPS